MPLQKWKLLSSTDVSPSKWFPIENRIYELPNGKIIDDFTVTTLADVAMLVPITKESKVVLIRLFKPGAGEIMTQFPAGRKEQTHTSILETAQHELEEETGISASQDQFKHFFTFNAFSTKATERVYLHLVTSCEFNSKQYLDENEEIEVLPLSFSEVDQKIMSGEIWCGQTIAAWELAKKKFPEVFGGVA